MSIQGLLLPLLSNLVISPAPALTQGRVARQILTQGSVERQILTPSGGANGAAFGVSTALAGDVAVVGAIYDAEIASRAGAAYVYERDPHAG